MHLYVDIGDALFSLWGSTSSLIHSYEWKNLVIINFSFCFLVNELDVCLIDFLLIKQMTFFVVSKFVQAIIKSNFFILFQVYSRVHRPPPLPLAVFLTLNPTSRLRHSQVSGDLISRPIAPPPPLPRPIPSPQRPLWLGPAASISVAGALAVRSCSPPPQQQIP